MLPSCCRQVGNGKLTLSEQKAHFALWALLKAPLLIGTDLRNASAGHAMNGHGAVSEKRQHVQMDRVEMLNIVQNLQNGNVDQLSPSFVWTINRGFIAAGADTKSILLAEEVIAINQDPLGVAGDLIWKQGPNEVWHICLLRCLECSSCRTRCTPLRQLCTGGID